MKFVFQFSRLHFMKWLMLFFNHDICITFRGCEGREITVGKDYEPEFFRGHINCPEAIFCHNFLIHGFVINGEVADEFSYQGMVTYEEGRKYMFGGIQEAIKKKTVFEEPEGRRRVKTRGRNWYKNQGEGKEEE